MDVNMIFLKRYSYSSRCFRRCAVYIIIMVILMCFILLINYSLRYPNISNFLAGDIVDFSNLTDFSNSSNVTGYSYPIVPNIIHLIHFESSELSFIDMVNIKSIYINHKPEQIIIHCDCYNLTGKYWEMIKNIPGLSLKYKAKPTHIFGKQLSSVYHSSDIARIQILMSYGGIYLDNDVYVVKSLDFYRKFEFALGWPPEQCLGNQVLIAHKNARFLKLYYQTYKYYDPTKWYYNAGELPTDSILQNRSDLVHRVPYYFGVHNLAEMLYGSRNPFWRYFYTIHLLIRHRSYLTPDDRPAILDEENIKTYDKTFGDMARLVLYGSTHIYT